MQSLLDPSFLLYLLFAALICLITYNLTSRPRGIHGAFINDDEGEQNAARAEIQAPGGINRSFINRMGKQNLASAKINCAESSGATDSEVYHIKNILLQLIAYLFGREQYPPNKGKQI